MVCGHRGPQGKGERHGAQGIALFAPVSNLPERRRLTPFTVLDMTRSHGSVRSYVCTPLFLLRELPYTPLLNSSPLSYEGSTCDSEEERVDAEKAQRLLQCCPASKA